MAFERVVKVADADFPTRWGHFRILGFEGHLPEPRPCCEESAKHGKRIEGLVAPVMGDSHAAPRCDCRLQLELALSQISQQGSGILLYEQQEGRGIGLMAKLRAYELQDHGRDTVEANEELGYAADCREFELPAEVLKLLGVSAVRLITNNPEKVAALETGGIAVVERVSAEVVPQETFEKYLKTKHEKMGHIVEALAMEEQ